MNSLAAHSSNVDISSKMIKEFSELAIKKLESGEVDKAISFFKASTI